MSMHPTITAALADQHRRDMIARAEAHRIARAARRQPPGARAHHADHPASDRGGAPAGHPSAAGEGHRDRRSRQ